MKKFALISLLLVLTAVVLYAEADLHSDDADDVSSLFPEQIVFRVMYGGAFTIHTGLTFLYPAIPETDEGRYIYWFNSRICHQRFDRSFFIGDYPIAACARCTGINVGSTIGSASYIFRDGRGELTKDSFKDALMSAGVHGLIMVPMAADGLIQKYTEYESDNLKRVVTGLLYGYGSAILLDEIVWFLSASIRSIFD